MQPFLNKLYNLLSSLVTKDMAHVIKTFKHLFFDKFSSSRSAPSHLLHRIINNINYETCQHFSYHMASHIGSYI